MAIYSCCDLNETLTTPYGTTLMHHLRQLLLQVWRRRLMREECISRVCPDLRQLLLPRLSSLHLQKGFEISDVAPGLDRVAGLPLIRLEARIPTLCYAALDR